MSFYKTKIGIVGATGEVGRTILKVLEERRYDFAELRLFASKKSAGKALKYREKNYTVEELTEDSMKEGFDFLLFSAGKSVSKKFAPIAAKHGSTVIDNSSAFRMDEKIPLVVPEINSNVLNGYGGIIANPNCSTIQMVLVLNPILREFGIKRVVVTTLQAVSGSGHKGIVELEEELKDESYEPGIYPKRIANNCLPHIGDILENGFSEEEMKMVNETRKIMECDCDVEATTVRVPVIYGHSESVYVQLEKKASLKEIKEVLSKAPDVEIWEDYPTPIEVRGNDKSHVGRIRVSHDGRAILFWNVADNVRVGAATNAVRILEKLLNNS